jgi:hypothetical protein
MSNKIVQHHVDLVKIQGAYKLIVDTMDGAKLNRAEAAVAMLAVLGVQFNGRPLEPERMAEYISDASGWLNLYFMEPTEKEKA